MGLCGHSWGIHGTGIEVACGCGACVVCGGALGVRGVCVWRKERVLLGLLYYPDTLVKSGHLPR